MTIPSAAPPGDGLVVTGLLPLPDLLNACPDGIAYVDADGVIRLANRRLEEIFGYDSGALIDQPVDVLVPVATRPQHRNDRALFDAAPHMRPMGWGRQVAGRRANGGELEVEISLSAVVHAGRRGVIAVVRDDTDRRERELQHTADAVAAEEVRIAQQLVDTVIASLFRAGLTLHGTLDLASPVVRARLEQTITEIDEAIRAMRQVIFDGTAAGPGPAAPGVTAP